MIRNSDTITPRTTSLEAKAANFSALIKDMSSGFQMPGVSFLQHGEIVADRFSDLLGDHQMTWRLPIWFLSYRDQIVSGITPDLETIKAYQVYHDCGSHTAEKLTILEKPTIQTTLEFLQKFGRHLVVLRGSAV